MSRALPISLVLLLVAACGDSGSDGPPTEGPDAPAENDPRFEIQQIRNWYLIGNELTPGHDELIVQVFAPDGTDTVDVWVAGKPGVRLQDSGTDFRQIVDISDLGPGEHTVVLSADGGDTAFASVVFRRSHPLYIVVTTDWDDADNSDASLALQQELHDEHDELLLTHFVGPYTFTDPTITPARRTELVNWTLSMRDTYGDEIGLHIHPYCNFVDTTSVTCRTEPSTVYEAGDPTGYTIMCAAYTTDEFTTLLEASDALFEANGLGKPTSFRAGGWTADASTLQALANAGYVADTSANNWTRMEEWEGVQNGVLYEWNKTNWATINDTSQPYYPSASDILTTGADAIPVLQVPDNGILVDYVSDGEMIEIFDKNAGGTFLAEPRQVSVGYHPTNFNSIYKRELTNALTHYDSKLSSRDLGPAVYARLSDLVKVWPAP